MSERFREKRREKKRKANAKKLAKKHEENGTTPDAGGSKSKTSAVKVEAAKASDPASSRDSGSVKERTGNAQAQPAPVPRSYYDPFTKKRVVIGSGSAAALGDSRAVKMGEAPPGATTKPQQAKAKGAF